MILAAWYVVISIASHPFHAMPMGDDIKTLAGCEYMRTHAVDRKLGYDFDDGKFGRMPREAITTACVDHDPHITGDAP